MSEVILDTITGKSTATTITIGSTPVVSASANSMTIRGEGSAQTSIQQGLSKLFVKFQGDNASVNDSFNVSSVDDDNTGYNGVNFTTNMAAIHYATHSTTAHNYGTSNDGVSSAVASSDGEAGMTTSSVQLSHLQSGGSNGDPTAVHVTIDGDLA
jgi:hypothetical protein